MLQRADLQAVVFDFGDVRSRGRGAGPASTLPSSEKNELWQGQTNCLACVPVISAGEVGALRSEGDDLVIGRFDHPGRLFLRHHAPAVDAGILKLISTGEPGVSWLISPASIQPVSLGARGGPADRWRSGWRARC